MLIFLHLNHSAPITAMEPLIEKNKGLNDNEIIALSNSALGAPIRKRNRKLHDGPLHQQGICSLKDAPGREGALVIGDMQTDRTGALPARSERES